MNFLIFVAGRIRNGQRVGLKDFPYSEKYEKYLYKGRPLTLEEFNEASEIVFNANYRNNGFSFCPKAIPIEVQEPAKKEVQKAKTAPKIEDVSWDLAMSATKTKS
jgi:hypothetical protein